MASSKGDRTRSIGNKYNNYVDISIAEIAGGIHSSDEYVFTLKNKFEMIV